MNDFNTQPYFDENLSNAPEWLHRLLGEADIQINGRRRWDMQVNDPRAIEMLVTGGSLGIGEAYMEGYWDSPALDQFFARVIRHSLDVRIVRYLRFRYLVHQARHLLFNLQSPERAFEVGEQHYDIGNDIFEIMLDSTMSYSCGYWEHAKNLEEAQYNKLDMICRKLELKPGDKLLDIGCGWGGLARHAAEHYDVEVTGITVSREQLEWAAQRCQGLPVKIELADYRELNGEYDKIVSVGMFEHVGFKNYEAYFNTVKNLLKPDGLFLLHTIGSQYTSYRNDPWVDKYIFPNGYLPSMKQICEIVEGRMIIEDVHNFGMDYDKTLMAWWERFNAGWSSLSDRYDRRFYRMWKYYLHCFAGAFRARRNQLWQLILSRPERSVQYRSIRPAE